MSMPAELMRPHATLDRLLNGFADAPALTINGIATDSRRLRHGDVFFAVEGGGSHGLDYLDQALAAGVAAIVWDTDTGRQPSANPQVPVIPVAALASRLGTIANRWFGSPSRDLAVSGVTGTNGKTTVAFLIAQSMMRLGTRTAYIGTLGAGFDELDTGSGLTTPPCFELHEKLADFRDAGARRVAIEVSSHGLEQHRVDGVRFDTAIFTNLSRDHIDYHGDMRCYGETKARLFLGCDPVNRIVCVDTEFGHKLAGRCGRDTVIVSTGLDRVADARPYLVVSGVVTTDRGSSVRFRSSWGDGAFELGLPGDFNIANAMLVLAQLIVWQVPLADACEVISQLQAPPGRMQRVAPDALPAVYVDYAHTPAGLEATLRALRSHSSGKLWCVFGCGGGRDHGKRALMGKIATRLADRVIVTTDNPRDEPPEAIIAEVLGGMDADAVAIEDRAAAIAWALRECADDDTVLIAGKGHEVWQQVGDRRLPFSDCETARANLAARHAKSVGSQ